MKLKSMCLMVVGAMIYFSGCTTSSAPKSVGSRTLTATGAVIVKQDALSFYYKKQCLACGFVSEQEIGSTFPKGKAMIRSDFTCPKCGKKQDVRIDIN